MEKFTLLILLNGIALPVTPGATAVTTTVAPDRAAVTVPARSAFTAVTILLPSVVVLELSVT
jgi:hypothetical protein